MVLGVGVEATAAVGADGGSGVGNTDATGLGETELHDVQTKTAAHAATAASLKNTPLPRLLSSADDAGFLSLAGSQGMTGEQSLMLL